MWRKNKMFLSRGTKIGKGEQFDLVKAGNVISLVVRSPSTLEDWHRNEEWEEVKKVDPQFPLLNIACRIVKGDKFYKTECSFKLRNTEDIQSIVKGLNWGIDNERLIGDLSEETERLGGNS
jgi:hypothetical protein